MINEDTIVDDINLNVDFVKKVFDCALDRQTLIQVKNKETYLTLKYKYMIRKSVA